MYFQWAPTEDATTWRDDRIWAELRARVNGPDFALKEGPIIQRGVIPMRSHVCEPMSHGRLDLAGDVAHVVPPTGAKGLNLAVADVVVLAQALEPHFHQGSSDLLDSYGSTALRRVWRAQHFSWWMTSMPHTDPGEDAFDRRRRRAELDLVTGSEAGRSLLAENYTGAPITITHPDSVFADVLEGTARRTS